MIPGDFPRAIARRHGAEVQLEDDTSIASHVDSQCHFAKNLIICRKIWQNLNRITRKSLRGISIKLFFACYNRKTIDFNVFRDNPDYLLIALAVLLLPCKYIALTVTKKEVSAK